MRFAFCILKFFPFGGLQRDFLQVARSCARRGHEVHVFTRSWEGDIPDGISVIELPPHGLTNHARQWNFYRDAQAKIAGGRYDVVVGFNKMPGLDVYFSGDVCFIDRAQKRSVFYRWTPRFRRFAAMEKAVFKADSATEVLLLVDSDREVYMRHYGTSPARFHLLPPDVPKDRHLPENGQSARHQARGELGIAAGQKLILALGSGFKIKGLDRSLVAIAALPPKLREKTKLMVIGQDNPGPFQRLSSRLRIAEKVEFLGGRSDVPRFLFAADLLLHPAYFEAAGTVLLEAMAAGLPVLTTDTCGFAPHVLAANGGKVLASPFRQDDLNAALLEMLSGDDGWGERGMRYIQSIDVNRRADVAVNVIERAAERKAHGRRVA